MERIRSEEKIIATIEKEDSKDFNDERDIIGGMIVSSEFIKTIRNILNLKILTPDAKKIALMCFEYFDRYERAPGKDFKKIVQEKIKIENLPPDYFDTCVNGDLIIEFEKGNFNVKFLIDRSIRYLNVRNATILKDELAAALEKGDMPTFNKLHNEFKPIEIDLNENKLKPSEMYNKKFEDAEWLIENLVPKGLSIFAGKSKLGKSYLILNMIMNLAQGRYMFDDDSSIAYRGKRGPILYLALEDTERRISERMKIISPNPDTKPLDRYLTIERFWKHLNDGGLTKIEDWLKAKKSQNPVLIVIDVMAKVWDMKASTSGGRQYSEEYSIYGPLSTLAHKYNVSIIAITHTKKGKESDVFDEILGGAGTQGPADNLMVLSPNIKNPKNQRILAIRGKDIEEQRLLFDVSNKGGRWIFLGESEEFQKTTVRQSLFDYLETAGAKNYKEIVAATRNEEIDISVNSIAVILRKMVTGGELEQSYKYGKYSVAGSGAKLANFNRNIDQDEQKSL